MVTYFFLRSRGFQLLTVLTFPEKKCSEQRFVLTEMFIKSTAHLQLSANMSDERVELKIGEDGWEESECVRSQDQPRSPSRLQPVSHNALMGSHTSRT